MGYKAYGRSVFIFKLMELLKCFKVKIVRGILMIIKIYKKFFSTWVLKRIYKRIKACGLGYMSKFSRDSLEGIKYSYNSYIVRIAGR